MNELLFFKLVHWAYIILAILVFIILFYIPAGYGRYKLKKWGPAINNTVAWIIMESIAPILFFYYFIFSNYNRTYIHIIFLLLWELHYCYRAFIYPFLLKGNRKMPIIIVLMGMIFNLGNSYLQGKNLFCFNSQYSEDWFLDIRFLVGIIIFIFGFIVNTHSDHILRKLRKPNDNNYYIPQGGLFNYISSPNYFGEMCEWIGWAILTWSLSGFIFALWTFANLFPRAISNHKWYLKHFSKYPKSRKAVIPYII